MGDRLPLGGHTEPTGPVAPNCNPCHLPVPGSFPAHSAHLDPANRAQTPGGAWEAPVLTAVISEMEEPDPRLPPTTSL